jgi:hypothetical protein
MDAGLICNKCHILYGTSWGNSAHQNHDDRTGDNDCIDCHVQIPHGWNRPRLIGYASDPAPYGTPANHGVTAISNEAHGPTTNWNKNDCGAGCDTSTHGLAAPPNAGTWP